LVAWAQRNKGDAYDQDQSERYEGENYFLHDIFGLSN
jgi:hypothetical protein